MEFWVLDIAVICFGLIIGSFLSVCIYRITLGRSSAVEEWDTDEEDNSAADSAPPNSEFFEKKVTVSYPPRSFCPQCGEQLRWYHNIPVVSWLLLCGRCAFCKNPISMRYPVVELLSGTFCFLSYNSFGLTPTGIVVYAFCCALIVITFTDLDYYIIPNVVTYPGTILGLVIVGVNQYTGWFTAPIVNSLLESLYGFLAGAGILLLISEGYLRLRGKEGLGMGDVKLLAMTGVLFGYRASYNMIIIGSCLGAVLGLLLILIAGRKASQYIPFGPYLAFAAVVHILFKVDFWPIPR